MLYTFMPRPHYAVVSRQLHHFSAVTRCYQRGRGTSRLGEVTATLRSSPPTSIAKRWHDGPEVAQEARTVSITFIHPDGKTRTVAQARVGESLLQTTKRNDDIDLEGACEGVCACSTCHLILPADVYNSDQIEEPSEDEEDMLDMAFGLTETSRLGCQVIVTPAMDGMVVEMPQATRNFYVDGHVPQGH
jgi:ferredoxin-2, mitochondrial